MNEASSSGGNSAKGDDDEGDNDEDDDDDDDDDDIVARASRIVDARRRSHDDGSAAPGNNDDDNIHDIGNGDDGIEDEEDEFEESERLWRRARLKLGPDEDREHYLCDEAGVLAALKQATRHLLSEGHGTLPPNANFALMRTIHGCADNSSIWTKSDGAILARLYKELGFEHQSKATLNVMVARECSCAWALPHVLHCLDTPGITELVYELLKLPESLTVSRTNYQKVLDLPQVYTEHSGSRNTEVTGTQVFPAVAPDTVPADISDAKERTRASDASGKVPDEASISQEEQQHAYPDTHSKTKIHISTFLFGQSIFYSKTEGCLFPNRIELHSHVAIRHCSLDAAVTRVSQIILLNALDLSDHIRAVGHEDDDEGEEQDTNGTTPSIEREARKKKKKADSEFDDDMSDYDSDISIVIERRKTINSDIRKRDDRATVTVTATTDMPENMSRRERERYERKKEKEEREREEKQKSSMVVMNALQSEVDDSVVWSLARIHEEPLEFAESVKNAFTLQFDVRLVAFVPLARGVMVEIEKLFVLHHDDIGDGDDDLNPLVVLEKAVFFDQKSAGYYGIHMYKPERMRRFKELQERRQQQQTDTGQSYAVAKTGSDFEGDVHSQLRDALVAMDMRAVLFDYTMLSALKKTWRNIGFFRKNYRIFKESKNMRSLQRHQDARRRRSSVDASVAAAATTSASRKESPALLENGEGRGADQNILLALVYRLRFSQAAHLRDVERHIQHLLKYIQRNRASVLTSTAHIYPRRMLVAHLDAVIQHANLHLLGDDGINVLQGAQRTIERLLKSLSRQVHEMHKAVAAHEPLAPTKLDDLMRSCGRLRNSCAAVSLTLSQGLLLRHTDTLERLAELNNTSKGMDAMIRSRIVVDCLSLSLSLSLSLAHSPELQQLWRLCRIILLHCSRVLM